MLAPVHLSEGLRFFKRRLFFRDFSRFDGDSFGVCRKIVDSRWNGSFFTVGAGNYSQFYCRDFGWCVPGLLMLGYRERVVASLRYALERFRRAGRIRVALTPGGSPFDFPDFPSLDSVAYLFNALLLVGDDDLIDEFGDFLQRQADWVGRDLVLPDGLPRPIRFSGMRDHAVRFQSCYDAASLGFLSRCLDELRFSNPLPSSLEYGRLLKSAFWTGSHFRDDLSGKSVLTADANVFPFYWGIIKSGRMLKSAFGCLRSERLDVPFPLRYVGSRVSEDRMLWIERFVRGWESDSLWAHMAFPYIELLGSFDKKSAFQHLSSYSGLISKYGNFLEVYSSRGEPFKTPFYVSDEGMLWAAQFLYVAGKLGYRG